MKFAISSAAMFYLLLTGADAVNAQDSKDFWSGDGFDEVAEDADRIATAQRAAERRAKEQRKARERKAREEAERVARIEARRKAEAAERRRAEVTAARNRAYTNSPILNAYNGLQNMRRQQARAQQNSSSDRYVPRPRSERQQRERSERRSRDTSSRLIIEQVDNSARIARERKAEAEYQRALREREARDARRRQELRQQIEAENREAERAAERAKQNQSKVYVEPSGNRPD